MVQTWYRPIAGLLSAPCGTSIRPRSVCTSVRAAAQRTNMRPELVYSREHAHDVLWYIVQPFSLSDTLRHTVGPETARLPRIESSDVVTERH